MEISSQDQRLIMSLRHSEAQFALCASTLNHPKNICGSTGNPSRASSTAGACSDHSQLYLVAWIAADKQFRRRAFGQ